LCEFSPDSSGFTILSQLISLLILRPLSPSL
jgi:hypothetical protein